MGKDRFESRKVKGREDRGGLLTGRVVRGLAVLVLGALVLSLPVLGAGCAGRGPAGDPGQGGPGTGPGTDPGGVTQPPAPTLAEIQKQYHPNELGNVLILEYHEVGGEEARWRRSSANFRKDLETLYEKGYRLVNLQDYLAGKIDLPAGMSPVVLTFDDSDPGQFRYLIKDGQPVIDPDSAVGMLVAFHEKHPDFGLAGTFYVLWPYPFGQKDYARQKISFLINNGFEIGNHTMRHDKLSQLSAEEVLRELARPNKMVAEVVPGYQTQSLALPFGIAPRNPELLKSGSYEGTDYQMKAVLLVGAEPASSPFAKGFDPYRLPRVQAIQSELDKWFSNLSDPIRRYISDGLPEVVSVPKELESKLGPGLAAGSPSPKISLYEVTGP
ncbi:MAG TPA: polysaccharide deacetylase family protein [Bacillota bacterium]|jgi:hypothetical protein